MPSILLVDDHPELLDAYCLMLTDEGYDVCGSHNGVEALDHALREPPGLIITDWMMPLMGGAELCRQIRAHPALAHIPILVHTATPPSSPGPAQWDDCLIKPVPAPLLLATVKRWCLPRGAAGYPERDPVRAGDAGFQPPDNRGPARRGGLAESSHPLENFHQ
ncbi:Response regulator ArlR [Paraburkholderia caffeinitolerans]|uniref:Response regulator ArlR n=1 Tax=Paraburkholderia caffeinitolerans TaxID=1723730 RepID=A0A6J5GYA1_9BURK|nr:response regulator [Paraburkholderia caffeinitolerans]CAB3807540.1 Response regulator ArlR [Paraburkholderia caffeinitolerans]